MTEANEVLTKDLALHNNVAPNGRKFRTAPVKSGHSLFTIEYADDKGGRLPDELTATVFTSVTLAQDYLRQWLTRFWNMSDEQAAKNRKRNSAE